MNMFTVVMMRKKSIDNDSKHNVHIGLVKDEHETINDQTEVAANNKSLMTHFKPSKKLKKSTFLAHIKI